MTGPSGRTGAGTGRLEILLVLALAAGMAGWRLGAPSLNVDEVFSLELARMGLADLFQSLRADSHPPLFYLLLKAWSRAGTSEAWLRLLPVLGHLGAVALLIHWARRAEGLPTALFAGLLAGCSSWALYRSQEARQYGLLALLAWVSLYLLWRRRYALYGLVTVLGLYTHYNMGLLLPVPWLWRLLARDPAGAPPARPLLLAQAGILVAFAPWLPMLWTQLGHGSGTSTLLVHSVYARPLALYVADFFRYLAVGAHSEVPPGASLALTLLFLALVGLGGRAMRDRSLAALLGASILAPLAVAVAVQVLLGRGLFSPKHGHFLYLAVCFLAGAGLAELRERSRAAAAGVLATLLACQALSWHAATFVPEYQNPPWRQIVRDLEERARPGDGIVVFMPYHALAFHHYQSSELPLYRLEPHLEDPRVLPGLLEGLASAHPRVWLVLVHERLEDPEGRLPAAMDARFHRTWERVYPNRAEFDRVRTLRYETGGPR